MLTLGSLFDGIGGWLLAAKHAGVKPIWASEIEPFPMAVTAHHFPDVVQLGDITKLDGEKLPPVSILCAGSPCQDLSVAGGRKGLSGERSGLFKNAIDIVYGMRRATNGKYPRFFVWENVPGAFSSNKGMDFRAVLEEIGQTDIPMPANNKWANAGLVQCDSCEIAWRVLDAAAWGVPQRRKRIFLVADFAATNRRAGEILFVEPSVCRNLAESEGTEKGVTPSSEDGVGDAIILRDRAGKPGGGKGPLLSVEKSLTIQANTNDQVLFESHPNDSRVTGPVDVAPTVSARFGTGGNNTPLIMGSNKPSIYDIKNRSLGAVDCGETSPTLTAFMGTGGNNTPIVLNDQGGGVMKVEKDDKVGTLRAEAHGNQPIVLESNQNHATITQNGKSPTLPASMGMGGGYVPMVCAGFKGNQGVKARTLGYKEEQSPTLLAGQEPHVMVGVDLYNGAVTGETACTFNAESGTVAGHSGPSVMCFEPGIASRDGGHIYTDDKAPTLRATPGDNAPAVMEIITHDAPGMVTVRKNEVDTERLKVLLKESLKNSGLTRKDLAEKLNVPQTKVDHWFRSDNCFAIPDPDLWSEIKKLLKITTDEFDAPITEFVEKPCDYDSSNRIYDAKGIAPALTSTDADKTILTYSVDSMNSNAMKSSNPNSGFHETNTAKTLDTSGSNPGCNQGGNVVVFALEGNGARPSHQGCGFNSDGKMYTLNTIEQHAVAYGIDQQGGKGNANYTVDVAPTLCSDSHGTPHAVAQPTNTEVWTTSKASFLTRFTKEQAQSLLASDWKEPPVIIGVQDEEDV